MKVSELADRAGTSAKTIRFWESEGVLPTPPRRDNGYREYSDEDLCRVRIVVALRGLGLDPTESGRLAELCSTGHCDVMAVDLADRVAERRASVAAAIAELRHLDQELANLQRTLNAEQPQTDFCVQPTRSRACC